MAIKNDYFKKYDGNTNSELDFMQTCQKANVRDILGQTLQFDAYGVVAGKKGDYAIMHFKEYPQNFYFGGTVICEKLKEIDKDGMHDALKEEHIRLELKISQSGNEYIDIIFNV